MKKVFYLLTVIALVFTSCNPMEEIYTEIDAQEEAIIGDIVFTMETADYERTGDADVETNEAFMSYAQAEMLIPAVLADKYPVWGKGSSAIVTFAYDRLNSVINEVAYEVTNDDYTVLLGNSFPNFGRNHTEEAKAFLKIKYPDAVRGDLVELTYKYYNGGINNVVAKFVYTDEWLAPQELVSADYTAMGQRYPNFSNFDDAAFKIGVYLGTLPENTYAQAGDIKNILYTYTYIDAAMLRQFEDVITSYTYDGAQWNTIPNTIKFGHNGTVWEKDNTIKYTLTNDDYALIGNDRYNNFDVRVGSDDETVEARLAKINTILLNNFPADAEGQKYIVSYNIYNGSSAVWTMDVIKVGSEYVLQ